MIPTPTLPPVVNKEVPIVLELWESTLGLKIVVFAVSTKTAVAEPSGENLDVPLFNTW